VSAKLPIPLDAAGCPDLQALVERAGRRYAASIGETYIEEPFRRMREAPHKAAIRISPTKNGPSTIVR
jgi:hypothetical protein